MVDIFRNSSHIMPVVEEALKLPSPPKVIWMQLGARDDAAAAKAEAAGLQVVMNRCPKIEWGRLSSEISWMGVNSRTISSKRAPIPTQGMRLSLNRTSVGGGTTASADRVAKNRTETSRGDRERIAPSAAGQSTFISEHLAALTALCADAIVRPRGALPQKE